MLRRMHRKYRPWHYRDKIMKIRNAMPSAAIGADVDGRFPGRDQEFNETWCMVEELPFTSPRVPGRGLGYSGGDTCLGSSPRWSQMRETGSCATLPPRVVFGSCERRGHVVEAITFACRQSDFTEALTDNYLKLKVAGQLELNRWLKVRVDGSAG